MNTLIAIRNSAKKYWLENRTYSYFIICVILLTLAHFGLFSISITLGPISVFLGNSY